MTSIIKTATALLLAAALSLTASTAMANTAANTEIINRARLTFNGGQTAESTVTVTVALVPSTPNVEITRADAVYTGVNTPAVTNTVTITATTNGPSTYTVTPSVTASTNTQGAAPDQPSVTGGATVTIGASVSTGTSGTTYVTVPASGASGANPAAINGIAINDTIVFTIGITTYTRTVASFTDNGDGTYRINFSGGATPVAPTGTQIGERYQVNLTSTPGTIQTLGTDLTTTVQAVVSTPAAPFGGSPAPANATVATTPPNKWTSTSPSISFQKYSRNVNNSAGNAAGTGSASISINGATNTYYTGGVTGKPGDIIEYVIRATNNGTADLTNCAISDQLPVSYVSDPLQAYGGVFHIFYIDTNGATAQITAGAPGANLASYVSPNLNVNVGVGATGAAAGTIPPTRGVTVAYQTTIK